MGGSTDGLELVGGGCVRAGVRVSPVSRGSARALGARSACAPCRVSSPFTGCLRSSAFHTLSVCLSHPRLVGVGARAGLSERICEMGTLELIMFLVPNPASHVLADRSAEVGGLAERADADQVDRAVGGERAS